MIGPEQRAPHSPIFSDDPTYQQVGMLGTQWRTDVQSAIDWLGSSFKVGDRVMYCIGAGRGQMMAVGTVVQIRSRKQDQIDYSTREKVGEVDVVEVQVLTKRTSGHWDNETRTRPAWVNPMNITSLVNLLAS